MTISSQQYAALADNSYDKTRQIGAVRPENEKPIDIDGVKFKILEHAENRLTGYAGTVYQRVDTGEIVVAHRGTDDPVRDGLLVDAGMVLTRSNAQQHDALALVQH